MTDCEMKQAIYAKGCNDTRHAIREAVTDAIESLDLYCDLEFVTDRTTASKEHAFVRYTDVVKALKKIGVFIE